jgi:hypothetical protein
MTKRNLTARLPWRARSAAARRGAQRYLLAAGGGQSGDGVRAFFR